MPLTDAARSWARAIHKRETVDLRKSLREAKELFLFLDYDGTLVPLAPTPEEARPDTPLLELLRLLLKSPRMRVALVSGRPIEELSRWFPLRGLFLVGNHGAEVRVARGRVQRLADARRIRPALEALRKKADDIISRYPGALLEDKGLALGLHYRRCSEANGRALRRAFRSRAEPYFQKGLLEWYQGKKVLEVRPRGLNKGTAVLRLLNEHGRPGQLPFYAGDDGTDEDAFKALRDRGITLKVGAGGKGTAAQHSLRDPSALRELLQGLSEKREEMAKRSKKGAENTSARSRRAKKPFRFTECFIIHMPTGENAANLKEFLYQLRRADDEVIYHHMYQAFLGHSFQLWDYPNDFARWASRALGEPALAEKLSSIDPFSFADVGELKERVVDIVEEYLWDNPSPPWAKPGYEFFFSRSATLILPTDVVVYTLEEFVEGLKELGLGAIYYHFFEARHRLKENVDDFSRWIEENFRCPELVKKIREIDPYFYSLEELRQTIIELVQEQLRDGGSS